MYPELDQLDFDSLRGMFEGPPVDGEEYAVSYYDEVAIRIRGVGGDEGIEYLLTQARLADSSHLHAILLSLTMTPPVDRSEVRSLLSSHLNHAESVVVVSAIDGLAALGGSENMSDILERQNDERPLVRAAVLRYQAQTNGLEAITRLIEALKDSDPIVRQSAIDALDELRARDATADVLELVADPDPDVRQAAETFMRNLQTD